jgi:hypothetical protein
MSEPTKPATAAEKSRDAKIKHELAEIRKATDRIEKLLDKGGVVTPNFGDGGGP